LVSVQYGAERVPKPIQEVLGKRKEVLPLPSIESLFLGCHFTAILKQTSEKQMMMMVMMMMMIFINCNWVVTRWQWLFYMYTKYEIGY